MFTRGNSRQRDGRVREIRRGDDDRLHVVPLHDLFISRRGDVDASSAARPLQCPGVAVAERNDSGFGTQLEAREMILQRDAAATDDGNADLFHDAKVRVEYAAGILKDKCGAG